MQSPSTTIWKQELTEPTSNIELQAKTLAPSRLTIQIKATGTPPQTEVALYWSAIGPLPHNYLHTPLAHSPSHCTLFAYCHTTPAPTMRLDRSWNPAEFILQPETGSYYLQVHLPQTTVLHAPRIKVKTCVTPQ